MHAIIHGKCHTLVIMHPAYFFLMTFNLLLIKSVSNLAPENLSKEPNLFLTAFEILKNRYEKHSWLFLVEK